MIQRYPKRLIEVDLPYVLRELRSRYKKLNKTGAELPQNFIILISGAMIDPVTAGCVHSF